MNKDKKVQKDQTKETTPKKKPEINIPAIIEISDNLMFKRKNKVTDKGNINIKKIKIYIYMHIILKYIKNAFKHIFLILFILLNIPIIMGIFILGTFLGLLNKGLNFLIKFISDNVMYNYGFYLKKIYDFLNKE